MSAKSENLQIRVSREQKTALKRAAKRAGLGMSAFVLARSLPRAQARLEKLLGSLRTDPTKRGYALAELNDLLTELSPDEFGEAVANAPLSRLEPYVVAADIASVEPRVEVRDGSRISGDLHSVGCTGRLGCE